MVGIPLDAESSCKALEIVRLFARSEDARPVAPREEAQREAVATVCMKFVDRAEREPVLERIREVGRNARGPSPPEPTHGRLPDKHHPQEDGALVVLCMPLEGVPVHALFNRRVVGSGCRRYTPEHDVLVLFEEHEMAGIDEPIVRGHEAVVRLVELRLSPRDSIVRMQRFRDGSRKTLLCGEKLLPAETVSGLKLDPKARKQPRILSLERHGHRRWITVPRFSCGRKREELATTEGGRLLQALVGLRPSIHAADTTFSRMIFG